VVTKDLRAPSEWRTKARIGLSRLSVNPVKKRRLMAMLLKEGELTGGLWIPYRDLALRPRLAGIGSSERQRTHASVTVLRSFLDGPRRRYLLLQLAPFPSESDANKKVQDAHTRVIRNSGSEVASLFGISFEDPAEYVVEDLEVAGLANARFLEIRYGNNEPVQDQILVGSTGRMLLIADVLSADGPKPWDEIIAIAESQIAKLNRR